MEVVFSRSGEAVSGLDVEVGDLAANAGGDRSAARESDQSDCPLAA
jgi:hypothetical protein